MEVVDKDRLFDIKSLTINGEAELTLEEIRARVDDPQTSVTELVKFEQMHYKPMLQRLVFEKTTAKLQELITVFEGLARLAKRLGDLTGKLAYYTDAAILYQHMLVILEEKISGTNNVLKIDPYAELAELQKQIFIGIGADQTKMLDVKDEANSNRTLLLILREQVKEKLGNTTMDPENTRNLYAEITNEMINFLAKVYSATEGQMGTPPPCSYAIIGLGSMALQQITPYSDLEFAILVDNEDFRSDSDPKIRNYFENLSHLAHFKVIGLRETVIAFSKYGVDTSHLVHVGVNFDLGGKTPLGRIDNDKPYSLIKTVNWMLRYVYNEDDKASHIDKNLPYILENVCFVYGNEDLVTEYQTKIAKFLSSKNQMDPAKRLNCEIRAIKLLEEGAVEFDYCRKALEEEPRRTAFKGDMDKLEPKMQDTEGVYFSVKQDIYRLPDRLIYNIGLFFNATGSSGWDIIDQLHNSQILTERAANNLKRAVSFATLLRLKAYLHNQAQDDRMSIFPKQNGQQSADGFQLSDEDFSEKGELFQYYYIALPLYEVLQNFCNRYQDAGADERSAFGKLLFRNTDLYKDSPQNKSQVYVRLSQYAEAARCLEQAAELVDENEKVTVYLSLGTVYHKLSRFEESIETFQKCLNILQDTDLSYRITAHTSIGRAYNNNGQYELAIASFQKASELLPGLEPSDRFPAEMEIAIKLANVYLRLTEFDKAQNCIQSSLERLRAIHGGHQRHLDFSELVRTMGNVCQEKGEYDRALEYYEEALLILKRVYRDQPFFDVAVLTNDMAGVLMLMGQYDRAKLCLERSLEIQNIYFKGKPHTFSAHLLNRLGALHGLIGQDSKAEEYLFRSLEIASLAINGEVHPTLAAIMCNLGETCYKLNKFDEARVWFEKNQRMLLLIHKTEDNFQIALTLNNLGKVFDAKAEYQKALDCFETSLRIKETFRKSDSHPDLTSTLTNKGCTLRKLERYDEAIECFERSLSILKAVHKEAPHMSFVSVLNNLGCTYETLNQYDKALTYFTQSLEMLEQIFTNKNHSDIVTMHHKMGDIHKKMNNVDQALAHYDQALEAQRTLPMPKIDAAIIWRNKGNTLLANHRPAEAIKCFEESLIINREVYKDEPHEEIAGLLNNLGKAFENLNRFDKALKYHQECLQLTERIINGGAGTFPRPVNSLYNLGSIYLKIGRFEEALKHFDRVIELQISVHGDHPSDSLFANLLQIATALQKAGRNKDAIAYFEKSLSYKKQEVSNEITAKLLGQLGNMCFALGHFEKARQHMTQCLQLKESILNETSHPSIVALQQNLGCTCQEMGLEEEAIDHFEKALIAMCFANGTVKNYFIKKEGLVLGVLNNLSLLFASRCEFRRAILACIQVLNVFARYYGLNFQMVELKFNDCLLKGLIFTDVDLHLKEVDGSVDSIIESYKLAAIFLSQANMATKMSVYDMLSALTGVSHENIDLWLAIEPKFTLNHTRLIMAIEKGDLQLITTLIELKCNVNECRDESEKASPLYCALGYLGQPVNLDIVKVLLVNGADANLAMCDGDTPMHMAHYKGDREAIKLLLSHGGDINRQNDEGKTSLHCLIEKEDICFDVKLRLCEELAGHYDVKLMTKSGETVSDYAARCCPDLLALFKK